MSVMHLLRSSQGLPVTCSSAQPSSLVFSCRRWTAEFRVRQRSSGSTSFNQFSGKIVACFVITSTHKTLNQSKIWILNLVLLKQGHGWTFSSQYNPCMISVSTCMVKSISTCCAYMSILCSCQCLAGTDVGKLRLRGNSLVYFLQIQKYIFSISHDIVSPPPSLLTKHCIHIHKALHLTHELRRKWLERKSLFFLFLETGVTILQRLSFSQGYRHQWKCFNVSHAELKQMKKVNRTTEKSNTAKQKDMIGRRSLHSCFIIGVCQAALTLVLRKRDILLQDS